METGTSSEQPDALGFVCAFCNRDVERSDTDPIALVEKVGWLDDPEQERIVQYWCHATCFWGAVHPAVPLYETELIASMGERWNVVRDAFKPDGALRDINVSGTTLHDWDRLVREIRKGGWDDLVYLEDGVEAILPESMEEVFRRRLTVAPTLRFSLRNIEVASHFFTPDEIELDLVPLQVTHAAAFNAIERFLAWIGRLLGKRVTLTGENMPEAIIAEYDPASDQVSLTGPG